MILTRRFSLPVLFIVLVLSLLVSCQDAPVATSTPVVATSAAAVELVRRPDGRGNGRFSNRHSAPDSNTRTDTDSGARC